MSWTAIFDIINKVLPNREERIRNKIATIKKEIKEITGSEKHIKDSDLRRYADLTNQLQQLEDKLQNR